MSRNTTLQLPVAISDDKLAAGCGAPDQEPGKGETLEAMRARHEAIARYRLILTDWSKPKGSQVAEVERGLTWKEVTSKRDQANAQLKALGRSRFGDPMYGVQLTNAWECMSEAARARHASLGKCQGDFDC